MGTAAPSLNTGPGWLQAVVQTDSSTLWVAVWYKPNCVAGETAPVFVAGNVMLAEFSGGATASPIDQTGTNHGTTTPVVVTAGGTDAASGELIIASSGSTFSKAGTTTTANSFNNGATATNLSNEDATSLMSHYRFSYGITTGNSGADTNSFSDTSMNLSLIEACVVSFKLAPVAFIAAHPIVRPNQAVQRASTWFKQTPWKKRSPGGALIPDLLVI